MTEQRAGAPRNVMESNADTAMSKDLASDAFVTLYVKGKAATAKQHALAQRRSKFFRPRRRQQMEQLLGSKNVPARAIASSRAAPPPLLQGITRKRWHFRSRNRAPSPSPSPKASTSSSTTVSSSLSTSPSSFLPTSDVHGGRLEPNGSSQMPLLTHVARPKSDSALAPAASSSQVPLLGTRSYGHCALLQPSPRRVFHLSSVCTPLSGTPPLPPRHTPPASAAASAQTLSPRAIITAAATHDVLSITEAHHLLPRLTLLRSRHTCTPSSHHHRRASSSSCESANAAPRKPMSRVDAFNSSRLSPASSAVAVPTAPFFELEDVTPDSQCGALRNWLAQPDAMSMDFRRGGATGPLSSTAGLTGALTGALHGVLHLSHTPPSCCSTRCASSLAVSPLRSLPPRRAAPTLSSLNSSMMSSAGDASGMQMQSMTPQECRACPRLDAHLDTITQEVTVESTLGAGSECGSAGGAATSEDLDALSGALSDASESTLALDTAMLPSVLPSCSVVGAAQRESTWTSMHVHGSAASGTPAARALGGTPRATAEGLIGAVTPTSGVLTDASGETHTPRSTPAPPSPDVRGSDARSCTAAVLHQASQLLSGQHDSCFDTAGSHGHALLWDSADAAPRLDCSSEKQVSDSTIVSYIDGTTGGGSPALLSCSDATTTSHGSKCSTKGKRGKWMSYLLCSCKAD